VLASYWNWIQVGQHNESEVLPDSAISQNTLSMAQMLTWLVYGQVDLHRSMVPYAEPAAPVLA